MRNPMNYPRSTGPTCALFVHCHVPVISGVLRETALLLTLFLLLDVPSVRCCSIELDYSYKYPEGVRKYENDTAVDIFHDFVHVRQALVVYMDFRYVGADGKLQPFSRSSDDSFAPDVMTWAKGTGRNLLRLPLDATVLSLGVLGIRSMHMEIVVKDSVKECLDEAKYTFRDYVNQLMVFLVDQVTLDSNVTLSKQKGGSDADSDLLCRPAYAFDYPLWGRKGIGFKCCSTDRDGYIVCDTPFSDGWQVIWWGPLALMAWMYLIILIKVIKTFRAVREIRKTRKRERKLVASGETTSNIATANQAMKESNAALDDTGTEESSIVMTANRLKGEVEGLLMDRATSALKLGNDKLMSNKEKITFLDVLGLSEKLKVVLDKYQKVVSGLIALLLYYTLLGYMTWQYSKLKFLFYYTADSLEMYINVAGHLGWLFTQPTYWIFQYAIFEAVISFSLPLMVLYVYFSLIFYRPRGLVEDATSNKTGLKGPASDGQGLSENSNTKTNNAESILENDAIRQPMKPFISARRVANVMAEDSENDGTASESVNVKGLPQLRFTAQPVSPAAEGEAGDNGSQKNHESHSNNSKPGVYVKDNRRNQGKNLMTAMAWGSDGPDSIDDHPVDGISDSHTPREYRGRDADNGGEQQSVDRTTRFFSTYIARILSVIFSALSAAYILLALGPWLAYIVFFIAFALFANVALVSPWLLPITLCLNYVSKVTNPAIHIYETARNIFFEVGKDLNAKEILTEDESTGQLFVSREVFGMFFNKQRKDLVFKTFNNIIQVIGMSFLMIMVTLALQYPMHLQSENTTAHLGMQMIFIVPLLGKMAGGEEMDDNMKGVLYASVRLFIVDYLKKFRESKEEKESGGQSERLSGD